MSGGAEENVMGNMVDSIQSTAPGPIYSSNSGFNGSTYPYPESKYYDSYDYGTTGTDAVAYARGYLGDATKEVLTFLSSIAGAWNIDTSNFVSNPYSWFYRGSHSQNMMYAGVWSFSSYGGIGANFHGFRLSATLE